MSVPVVNDSLAEGDETFTVTISDPPAGFTITNASGARQSLMTTRCSFHKFRAPASARLLKIKMSLRVAL